MKNLQLFVKFLFRWPNHSKYILEPPLPSQEKIMLLKKNIWERIHHNLFHHITDSFFKSPIFKELIRFELEEQQQGSGFNIGNVSYIDLSILKSTPLKASYIDLPKDIKNKKEIINIKNTDNKCFLWSILAHLYPQERGCERVSKCKKYENILETGDLGISRGEPMSLKDITKFENMNNLLINVYGLTDKNKVQILRVSNTIFNDSWSNDRHVDLLYFTNKETAHYSYIKNFSRLVSSQVYKSKPTSYPCKRCLNIFWSQQRLDKHLMYCSDHKAAVVEMPEPGEKVVFHETNKCIKHPFVIPADFESILEKTDDI